MKPVKKIFFVVLILLVGSFVGFFRGAEAKQKWVFKIKDKYDNRRQLAERRSIARRGGVLLDEIEIASFHQ